MAATLIRPRKDGGYSECSSPDEFVGKGRCCHILDGGRPIMTLERIQRGLYEVKVNDSEMTIKAQKECIVDFFNQVTKIDEEKQKEIVDYLNKED